MRDLTGETCRPRHSVRTVSDWLQEENRAITAGISPIAGIDEAGRGALAGPVVAACVILAPGCIPRGIDDSKKLTSRQRAACYDEILATAAAVGIGSVSVQEIDRHNILRATHAAMRQALAEVARVIQPALALIDGLPVNPFPIPQRAIVRGDGSCASIAAASIVAKVTRDSIMVELDSMYPAYGFAAHKGYGTRVHLEALQAHGPCAEHRSSFRPVALAGRTVRDPGCQQSLPFDPLFKP